MGISQLATTALTELERLELKCIHHGKKEKLDDIFFLRSFIKGRESALEHKVLNALKNVLAIEPDQEIEPGSRTAIMMMTVTQTLFIDGFLNSPSLQRVC